ncbi:MULTISPECIES: ComF family protein [Pseudomonas]|jgi:ComF family protein|uniref:ComF family protein n=1 Tax=Pseudomonas soli TaxID=1306993 RepID=A0A1H9MAP5_9PSED|nr:MULTISPECIES: ComF family protein [Pseudomonas]AUY34477.1 ComF family protein [Pseudomonas sp. PONIH3]MEE1880297.1 ComF family protein [Pseudomonas soli]SER20213.1 comF family protein [Pseudomonas soli]
MNCQPIKNILVYICTNIDQPCLLCDEPAGQPYSLCLACEQALPWLQEQCRRCALPLALDDLLCGSCSRHPPAFKRVIAPWHYGFPVDTLISRFKHNSQWPLGRLLAQLLGQSLNQHYYEGLPRPDCLLPVPLAGRRLRQRGFNQAAMLARWLGRQLRLPCDEHLLQRVRDTTAQQALGAKARQRNLRQAFALIPGRELQGLHLALVDDVLTTGATAQTIARLLRKAGARRVDIYCLARTPRPGQA